MASTREGIEARLVGKLGVTERSATESREEPVPALAAPSSKENPRHSSARPPVVGPVPPIPEEPRYAGPGELSVRPSPVGEIRVPYPESVEHSGIVTTMLTLFIDEGGAVVSVQSDDSELLPQFQEAARNGFFQARFHPGSIAERPVKSRMRVEVTFERADEHDRSSSPPPTSGARGNSTQQVARPLTDPL